MSWKNWPSWVKYWLKAAVIYIIIVIISNLSIFGCLIRKSSCGFAPSLIGEMYWLLFVMITFGIIVTLVIGVIMGSIADKLKSKSKKK